jgi:hypothetical protein
MHTRAARQERPFLAGGRLFNGPMDAILLGEHTQLVLQVVTWPYGSHLKTLLRRKCETERWIIG